MIEQIFQTGIDVNKANKSKGCDISQDWHFLDKNFKYEPYLCNSIETTYYQRNRDVMLNRAKHYYKNDKERLRDYARDKQKFI